MDTFTDVAMYNIIELWLKFHYNIVDRVYKYNYWIC